MIDTSTIVAVVTGAAGAAGGFVSGKQVNRVQKETIDTQAAALDALRLRIDEQDRRIAAIPELESRISVLTEIATQKANVEYVIEVVDRIEERLNGRP